MPTPIEIRSVQLEDAARIAAIYAPSVQDTAFTFDTEVPTPADMRARITKITAKHPWLVAEKNGHVIGYAYASPHRDRAAYRWSVEVSVYIDAAHQRKGVARTLYGRLFEIVKGLGYVNAYAGITLPNPASVKLHEEFGFEPVGVYKHIGYKLERWHDVGWWSLTLNSPQSEPKEPLSSSSSFL